MMAKMAPTSFGGVAKIPATTAWKFGASGKSVPSGKFSAAAWSNPGNAVSDNGSGSNNVTGFSAPEGTDYLLVYNFGLTSSDIPSGATITGVEVQVELQRANANIRLDGAIISKDANAGSPTIHEATTLVNTTVSSTSMILIPATANAIEMFGQTLTPSDLTAATFGVGIWCTSLANLGQPQVDYIQVRVNYEQ